MKLTNKKILITGGASGIGLGFTEQFVEDGNTVLICGRRESVLAEVSARFPSVITRVCDLSTPADREALYEWIKTEHSDLNVLVNNAGVQNWMSVSDDDFFSRAQFEVQVNIEAPIHLTSLFLKLPSLTSIINVTSGLAFVPFTKVPVYSATKAFFHSFTLSLRSLVAARGIEVVEVIPPALNTDLGGKGLHDHAPPVGDFITSVFEQMAAGKTEITFGLSDAMANGTPEQLRTTFNRLNATV